MLHLDLCMLQLILCMLRCIKIKLVHATDGVWAHASAQDLAYALVHVSGHITGLGPKTWSKTHL